MRALCNGIAGLLVLVLVGCVPYSLGTTAQPLPKGSGTMAMTYSIAQDASERIEPLRFGTPGDGDVPALDIDFRVGLNEHSDVGLRFVQLGGLSVTVKRRVVGAADLDAPAIAVLYGGGVLAWGDYLHGEVAVIASGKDRRWGLPYASIRTLATLPTRRTLEWDQPIAGAHLGWRLRPHWRLGILVLPELAVYYDEAESPGSSHWVVVPSLTVTIGPRGIRPRLPPRRPPQ